MVASCSSLLGNFSHILFLFLFNKVKKLIECEVASESLCNFKLQNSFISLIGTILGKLAHMVTLSLMIKWDSLGKVSCNLEIFNTIIRCILLPFIYVIVILITDILKDIPINYT